MLNRVFQWLMCTLMTVGLSWVWLVSQKGGMISISGPCLELGYSAFMCNQLLSCRSLPGWDLLWDAAQVKTDGATPGSTVSGATAVLELVNHSRRINLCWFCCSTRSLEVHSLPACLPSCGWTERGSRSGSRGKLSMICVGVFVPINCSNACCCGLRWSLECLLNTCSQEDQFSELSNISTSFFHPL